MRREAFKFWNLVRLMLETLRYIWFVVGTATVYPKKYAHGFVVLCFVVVMQSFIMNSHEVFIHIHQGCFAGTGAIVRLPQCQWSKPDGYGKNQSMYNHNKAQQSKNRVHISWDILYCMTILQWKTNHLNLRVPTFRISLHKQLLNNDFSFIDLKYCWI